MILEKLHEEQLFDLYLSSDIVWVMKFKTMRQMWHVAHMGEETYAYRV